MRSPVRRLVPALILAGGIALAAAFALVGGASLRDAVSLVALALAGAGVAVGLVILFTRGRNSSAMATHTASVALVSVSATTVGVVVGARAMFISAHDLTALAVIVSTATAAGLAVAWRLGSRLDRDVTALTQLSEELACGDRPPAPKSGIAELDRLARDLVTMADRLEEAHDRELALERSRRELVAWVSHDLRSPLAGIRAMAEAMEDGVVTDPTDVKRYLHSIGEEATRLAQLVDDLFELSRVTSGIAGMDARPMSLADLVAAGARGAEGVAEISGVELRLPTAAELGALPPVLASEADAMRVLGNLLDNAIRHTPAGGTVTIAVASGEDHASVSVSDECGGIPRSDLDQVFDVAFRGDTARGRSTTPPIEKGAAGGATGPDRTVAGSPATRGVVGRGSELARSRAGGGLGLAIAKGLVEAQQGSISVVNEGRGCTFTVRFPLGSAMQDRSDR